jgi:hypothetical protein
MSKIWSVRLAILGIFVLLGMGFAAGAVDAGKPAAGYGRCSKCSCPGYFGSGYTCRRGGCYHHYDSHW